MRGYFVVLTRKLPRIHVRLHCNANEKTNREKGYLKPILRK